MKNQLEAVLTSLKKQKTQTNQFIEVMELQKETAAKIKFNAREKSIDDIIEQEIFFLSIINLKIQKTLKSLQKFN